LAIHGVLPTGGYHHRQRVCQPFGLEKVPRHPFGLKPGDTHLAICPKTSIWIEARRAGTTSAGVEGPGDNAPQTATRPGGPIQPLPGSKAPAAMLFKPPQARRADTPYTLDLVGRLNLATLGCVSPSGLAIHGVLPTGGYHHRQRVCQPFGLEKVQRLQFGFRSKDIHLALSPKTSIWL
jgi:hypothetical protein